MKNLYYSFLFLLMTCGAATAQNSIILDIDHQLGGAEFAYSTETAQADYMFELTRLQYYISDMAITHDGGMTTTIEDLWILVNANGLGQFDLGSHDINNVESVSFYVGVGQDVNHDDPATWPTNHALYPQNPSMHWGWTSGYRFVAIEGNAGPTAPDNLFEIHALGDNNYFETSVAVSSSPIAGTVTIPLIADYANALTGIDLSPGVINHATSGVSVTLLQNFSTEVFSAGVVSSLEENSFDGSMVISPNPSQGQATLNLLLPEGEDYSINIIDLSGRSVHIMALTTINGRVELPILSTGVYILELQQANKTLTAARWVVK